MVIPRSRLFDVAPAGHAAAEAKAALAVAMDKANVAVAIPVSNGPDGRLEALLDQACSLKRVSVADVMLLCLDRSSESRQLAVQMADRILLRPSGPPRKRDIACLYCLSDVLHNVCYGHRCPGAGRYQTSFQDLLPGIMGKLYHALGSKVEATHPEVKDDNLYAGYETVERYIAEVSIRRVLKAWRDLDLFPEPFLLGLEAVAFGGVLAECENPTMDEVFADLEDSSVKSRLQSFAAMEEAALQRQCRNRGLIVAGQALPMQLRQLLLLRLRAYEGYWSRQFPRRGSAGTGTAQFGVGAPPAAKPVVSSTTATTDSSSVPRLVALGAGEDDDVDGVPVDAAELVRLKETKAALAPNTSACDWNHGDGPPARPSPVAPVMASTEAATAALTLLPNAVLHEGLDGEPIGVLELQRYRAAAVARATTAAAAAIAAASAAAPMSAAAASHSLVAAAPGVALADATSAEGGASDIRGPISSSLDSQAIHWLLEAHRRQGEASAAFSSAEVAQPKAVPTRDLAVKRDRKRTSDEINSSRHVISLGAQQRCAPDISSRSRSKELLTRSSQGTSAAVSPTGSAKTGRLQNCGKAQPEDDARNRNHDRRTQNQGYHHKQTRDRDQRDRDRHRHRDRDKECVRILDEEKERDRCHGRDRHSGSATEPGGGHRHRRSKDVIVVVGSRSRSRGRRRTAASAPAWARLPPRDPAAEAASAAAAAAAAANAAAFLLARSRAPLGPLPVASLSTLWPPPPAKGLTNSASTRNRRRSPSMEPDAELDGEAMDDEEEKELLKAKQCQDKEYRRLLRHLQS